MQIKVHLYSYSPFQGIWKVHDKNQSGPRWDGAAEQTLNKEVCFEPSSNCNFIIANESQHMQFYLMENNMITVTGMRLNQPYS